MCTHLMKAFGDSPNVKALCEPREHSLRIDDDDRTAYTREDMRLVLLSLVGREDRTQLDVADWHPLFADNTYRHIGMSTICTRLEGFGWCAKATVLDISNCGWSVEDLVQCVSTVAKIGQRACVPSVSVLPVGWSQRGACYRRPDGVYVREVGPPMEVGAYQPMPPLTAQMLSSSTEPLRCVICTNELSAHAPPLGQLHTLNLSHNRRLGDNVTPPKWVRGDRLAITSPRQRVGYRWTCPSSGEMYIGASPPGSRLLGAKALGDALLHHQTLTELDVSATSLRDRGCVHLVRGLTGNVSLDAPARTNHPPVTTDCLPPYVRGVDGNARCACTRQLLYRYGAPDVGRAV